MASPSHGLLVLTEKHLLGGGLPPANLDRRVARRLASISFDGAARTITLDITERARRTHAVEGEPSTRSIVTLDTSVTAARALAFVLEALERAG